MRFSNLWRMLGSIAVLVLFTGLVASCTDDDEPDAEEVRPRTSTPTAIVGMPEDVGETTITIEDGSFDTDTIEATEGQPVMFLIVNRDTEDYTFMVEEIIAETAIPATAETFVDFNAPNEGEFEGVLYGPDGEEISTLFINVTGPGGV